MIKLALGFAAAAVSLLAGCASGSLADRGYKLFSITYQYSDQNRPEGEWRALLTAQDECYTGGYQYAQPAGPPQIIGDGAMSGEHQATLSFYCVGLRGEG